jgi:two-component system, cell cycle response regulator
MKVLVIDDDPVTRLMLERLLTLRGYSVLTAINGEEGYHVLQTEDPPKLAIVDWMMPGMSGPELCRRLRERRNAHRTHIIMLTGKRGDDHVVVGLNAGADDYVRKPFGIDELVARLRAAERLICVQEDLRNQASTDDLTGVLNRGGILNVLRQTIAKAARDNTSVSVVLADVDKFKLINDTYGHHVGDVALERIAQGIKGQLRQYDAVGRYGGEEFLIVLPGCRLHDAVTLAERVRLHVCSQPIATSTASLSATISLGVGTSAGQTMQLDGLIHAADNALYRAKRAGRNRVEGPLHEMPRQAA